MDQQRRSILDYARSHGVASDVEAVDLIRYIDQTCSVSPVGLPPRSEKQHTVDNHALLLRASIEESIRAEKLDICRNEARLLSTVVQRGKTKEKGSGINWDDLLPSLSPHEEIKVEVPLLKASAELDLPSFRAHGVLNLSEIQLPPEFAIKNYQTTLQDITGKVKGERLECTKGSLKLIQDIKRSCELFHVKLKAFTRRCLDAERAQGISHERLSPLLPFGLDDTLYSSPSPQHMLPSPLLSSLPEGQRLKRFEDKESPALLRFLRCPSVRERIWLLGSSDIDDIEASSSISEVETSFDDIWKGYDTADVARPLSLGELSTLVKDFWEADPAETMAGGSPGLGKHNIASASHSISSNKVAQQSESQDLSNDTQSHCPPATHASLTAGQDFHFTEHSQEVPQRSALGCHTVSATENGYISNQMAQNDDEPEDNIHSSSPARRSQRNRPSHSLSQSRPRHGGSCTPRVSMESRENGKISYESVKSLRDISYKAQPGYKRRCESPKSSQRKRAKPRASAGTALNEPAASTSFTFLGSLSSFMETRGITPRPQTVVQSPYFDESTSVRDANNPPPKALSIDEIREEISTAVLPQIPQSDLKTQSPSLLILSTGLLRTHVPLIRYLEAKKESITLIYREYGKPEGLVLRARVPTSGRATPLDADIILSPTTGIILTTSQATTQLYLPGHKPTSEVGELESVNSPLREHIICVAARYERLYIFVSYSTSEDPNPSKSQEGYSTERQSPAPTLDRRTLEAFASLTAFCSSASAYASITALLVSSAPEIMGEWILSLVHKHAILSAILMNDPENYVAPDSSARATVVLSPLAAEKASNWELFLRQAGMNPFAALATLSIMRKHEQEELARTGRAEGEYVFVGPLKKTVRSLSKLIEMDKEQRMSLLEGIVGARVLKRVVEVIEQSLHCDWILDLQHERLDA